MNDTVLGPCLGPDTLLGHSYFFGLANELEKKKTDTETAIRLTWKHELLPQLIDTFTLYGAEDLLASTTNDKAARTAWLQSSLDEFSTDPEGKNSSSSLSEWSSSSIAFDLSTTIMRYRYRPSPSY